MLGHSYFYRNIIRTYVIAFGSLFKNIEIRDWDSTNGAWTDQVLVPISYGSKEKHLARVEARESTNESASITLPRIGFVITSISRDSSRVLNKMNRISRPNPTNPGRMDYIRDGEPYDISFSLSVMTKKTEDGTKIVEQILPFFTPNMNVTLRIKYHNENSTSDDVILLDVPITLDSVSLNEDYEGDFATRRVITWDFEFNLKGKIYGPVLPTSTDGSPVIKTAITKLSSDEAFSAYDKITIIPIVDGKTLDEITVDDDYEYLETIEHIYPD